MTDYTLTPHLRKTEPQVRPGLRARVMSAGVWSLASYGGSQVIRIGSSMVLTRLLMPEAYGLYTLVSTYMMGVVMFSDMGLGSYLFQSKKAHDQEFADSIWTIGVVRGCIVWLAAVALAWPMARFYEQPVLLPMLLVASLGLVVGTFQSTKLVLANRNLDQRTLAIFGIGTQAIGVVIHVALAWHFRSVWALVWAGLAGEIVRSAASQYLLPGRRNRWRWDSSVVRELRGFSGWIYFSSILGFLGTQADRLMIGKLMPIEFLGVYGIAMNLSMLPLQLVERASSLMSPVLVELRHAGAQDAQAKLQKMRTVLLRSGVAMVTLTAVGAPAFYGLLYDDRYRGAGLLAALLSLTALGVLLQRSVGGVLLAFGDARSITVSCSVRMVGAVGGALIGYLLGGPYGFVIGSSLGASSEYIAGNLLARRHGMSFGWSDWIYVAKFLLLSGTGWGVILTLARPPIGLSMVHASIAATGILVIVLGAFEWRAVSGFCLKAMAICSPYRSQI